MSRDLPLGNGNLMVTFDADYNLRDIYYPHVGKANHGNGCVSRTAVWVDGQFSWLDEPGWEKSLDYAPETLATRVSLTNADLGLRLLFQDIVDFNRDIFLRRVEVTNLLPRQRSLRLFFHYAFSFWEVGRGDTIHYDPEHKCLVAYKDDCYFLLNSAIDERYGIDDWATGHRNGDGSADPWVDTEAGLLSKSPISFGLIEGALAVHQSNLPASGSCVAHTWMAAGRNMEECQAQNLFVIEHDPHHFLARTMNYWRAWLNKEETNFHELPPALVRLYQRSLLIARTQIDDGGGIMAAVESGLTAIAHGQETYAYVWPRDGAFIANALDQAGFAYVASSFYQFCDRVINRQPVDSLPAESYQESAFMLHKFTPDGQVASSWMSLVDETGQAQLPIQEDETALLPYALWQHYLRYRDIEMLAPLFRTLVIGTGNFMVEFRDDRTGLPAPSYDLWEERRGIYSYTVSTVWAGLQAAANLADLFGESAYAEKFRTAAREIRAACETHLYDEEEGRFLKSVTVDADGSLSKDPTVDASLFALWYLGMFDTRDSRVTATMEAVRERLSCRTDVGGFARYEGDDYHWEADVRVDRVKVPGNPWIICSIWQAQYHIARAQDLAGLAQALPFLEWVARWALPSGVLGEQLHPLDGTPLGVSPLTWSHGAYVAAICEYLAKFEELSR